MPSHADYLLMRTRSISEKIRVALEKAEKKVKRRMARPGAPWPDTVDIEVDTDDLLEFVQAFNALDAHLSEPLDVPEAWTSKIRR